MEEPGRLQSMESQSGAQFSDYNSNNSFRSIHSAFHHVFLSSYHVQAVVWWTVQRKGLSAYDSL